VVEELVGGSVQRTYAYGLQRIDQLQITENQWTPSAYGYDGAGNVRQLTNAAGAVTDTYEYDAFGNSFTKTGTTPNLYLYRGEQYDSDLALFYLRARYYNTVTGRFMSGDPEEGKARLPQTLHKHLYASGDPVNRVDPSGRAGLIEFVPINAKPIGNTIGGIVLAEAIVRAFLSEDEEVKLPPDQHDPNPKNEPGGNETGPEPVPITAPLHRPIR
jgi:RHS repeat-associated protein